MTRVLIVPGAAVRSYVRPAADALRDRGVEVHLLAAPGEPDAPAYLRDYGLKTGLPDQPRWPRRSAHRVVRRRAGSRGGRGCPSPAPDPVPDTAPDVDQPDGGPAGPNRAAAARPLLGRRSPGTAGTVPGAVPGMAPGRPATPVPSCPLRCDGPHRGSAAEPAGEADRGARRERRHHLALVRGRIGHRPRRGAGRRPNATHSWPYADADRFADTVQALLT